MQTIILTNRKLDVAWMKIDSNLSSGYVSDYGVVKLNSVKPLQLLSGPIDAISYDSVKQLTVIIFNGKGNFSLGSNDLTWVWTGVEDQNWHNPENWQMQDHPSIHGIPVVTNSVVIPIAGTNMPVISSDNPAICRNLTIQSGAFLTVETMKYLTVTGTLTLESN